jgi:hypothetical protein
LPGSKKTRFYERNETLKQLFEVRKIENEVTLKATRAKICDCNKEKDTKNDKEIREGKARRELKKGACYGRGRELGRVRGKEGERDGEKRWGRVGREGV